MGKSKEARSRNVSGSTGATLAGNSSNLKKTLSDMIYSNYSIDESGCYDYCCPGIEKIDGKKGKRSKK